jgi:serine/threonine protein kinase
MQMVRLTGYKIVEKIYSSSETLVFRGIREKDEISVVIKFLRQDHPKFEKLVQFRNEYTIIKNLNIAGIIKTYGLENYENGYALVMEDFGGISLQEKSRYGKQRGRIKRIFYYCSTNSFYFRSIASSKGDS